MTDAASGDFILQLVKLAKLRRFEQFESTLSEYITSQPPDMASLVEAFRAFGQAKDIGNDIDPLLWLVATLTAELHGSEVAEAAIERLAAVRPDSRTLREEATRLLQVRYQAQEGFPVLVSHTLADAGVPLDEALAKLKHYVKFSPGIYVLEKLKARVGRVEGFDPGQKMFRVDYGKEKQFYAPVSMLKLERVDNDDYRALEVFEPQRLVQMAAAEPLRLVELVLRASKNELKFRDLKARLEPAVPKDSWAKWWKTTRELVRRNPMIDMPEGTQPTLTLRNRPLSAVERFALDVAPVDEPLRKLSVILSHVRALTPQNETDRAVALAAAAELKRLFKAHGSENIELALAMLAIDGEIRQRFDGIEALEAHSDASMIEAVIASAETFLNDIPDEALDQLVLDYIRCGFPDRAVDVFAALMPYKSAGVCEMIARELKESGAPGRLAEVLDAMTRRATSCVDGLVWAWKTACAGRHPELFGLHTHAQLLQVMIQLAARLGGGRSGSHKQDPRLPGIRSALATKDYTLAEEVIKAASSEEAGHINELVQHNAGLGGAASDLAKILRRRHPELFAQEKPLWEDGNIYVTAPGLRKRQMELEHMVKVEMPEVAQKLSHARAFGDLSENAEYDAAKEAARQLAERSDAVKAELAKAKVFERCLSRKGEVNVGCRVKAKNVGSGVVEEYSFLGPWDADHDRHIYSYLAPLSQRFMGKHLGDEVRYGEGIHAQRWEIVGIEPAL